MLVFNLRHMHTLAWKTNMVVFSIIYSRVSWWAFSLQKQMCIEQRYTCYLYRKCKSQHSEGDFIHGEWKNWNVTFFSCVSDHICLPFLILQWCITHVYSRWCNYAIILNPPKMHTQKHTHTHRNTRMSGPSFHISVSIFCMCYFILPCISTPLGPIWCPFLLCGPHDTTNPAHGLHIPLPVAAQF